VHARSDSDQMVRAECPAKADAKDRLSSNIFCPVCLRYPRDRELDHGRQGLNEVSDALA